MRRDLRFKSLKNPNVCPPPRGVFLLGEDETVAEAKFVDGPPAVIHEVHLRGVRRKGMLFERRVNRFLRDHYGEDSYLQGPWVRFVSAGERQPRWCQPDAIIVDELGRRIIIVEIKLRHTSDAWYQLRRLYEPVLRVVYGPRWDFALCEVVKWFDPSTAFPERFDMVKMPHEVSPWRIGVCVYASDRKH